MKREPKNYIVSLRANDSIACSLPRGSVSTEGRDYKAIKEDKRTIRMHIVTATTMNKAIELAKKHWNIAW